MQKIRFGVGFVLGMILTGIFGTSALILSYLGKYAKTCKKVARLIPEIWGMVILFGIKGVVMGKRIVLTSPQPPSWEGFTLIICNHPPLEELPDVQGALGSWGLRPSVVSKIENLNGVAGFFIGKPLKEMERGVFISQNGGTEARAHLKKEVNRVREILIYPDQHRPTQERIKADQEKFPGTGLTLHCVPRSGGVHSILCAAIANGRRIRVLDITWRGEKNIAHANIEDATSLFILKGPEVDRVFPEETIKNRLLELWQKKEKTIRDTTP